MDEHHGWPLWCSVLAVDLVGERRLGLIKYMSECICGGISRDVTMSEEQRPALVMWAPCNELGA